MAFGELLPMNWGRRQVPVRRSSEFDWPMMPSIDRMFDDLLGGFDGLNELTTFVPPLDVRDTDKELVVSAELPGMEEKDIDISLSNNVLTVSGEKKSEHEEKGKDSYRMERRYGSFKRSVQLPAGLDVDKAEASYKNGVLSIKLPKTAEYRESVKRIPIKPSNERHNA